MTPTKTKTRAKAKLPSQSSKERLRAIGDKLRADGGLQPLRAQDPVPPSVVERIVRSETGTAAGYSDVRSNIAISMKEYGGLQDAFDFMNSKLFDGKLPDVMFNYVRKPNMRGHFADDRYSGRVDEFKKPELALNPDAFVDRSDEQIVSTLAHEMTHLAQYRFGKPSARGYHNREWSSMMKSIGLMPSNTGAVGGKETGQRMSHYIIPGAPFATAFADLAATGWKLNLQSTMVAGGEKKPRNDKTKFSCVCGQNAWGKPDLGVVCKPCLLDQLNGIDGIEPQMVDQLVRAVIRATMVSERAEPNPDDVVSALASYDQQAAE